MKSLAGFILDTIHAARVLAEEGALALGRVFERAAADFGGDCPTCSWPSRETVGMVCQTCGWDYMNGEKP